jgi:hypothetical protein
MPTSIYLLKITLMHIKPPIYRMVLVSSDTKLSKLHSIIQLVMGWHGSHLHQFIQNKRFYGPKSDDLWDDCEDYTKLKVSHLLEHPKEKMVYEYDFGDSWNHEILLEKVLPYDAALQVPTCVDGKRACPPEDCGGPWGYANLLETLKNPDSPEARELFEWGADGYDPEYFEMKEANEFLQDLVPKTKKKTNK